MKSPMRLLVGYDGSECAEAALADLQHAGLPAEVSVIVISIADVFWLPPEGSRVDSAPPGWLASVIEQAHGERSRAVEQMRAMAVFAAERLRAEFPMWTVQAEAQGDSPAWGLLKRADEWHPDLIVLGSQGRSALARIFLGSVSQKVLTAASCSVRIARRRPRDPRRALRLIVGVDGSSQASRAVRAVKERLWPPGTVVRLVSAMDAFMSSAVISQDETIRQWVKNGSEAETWVHRMVSAAANDLRAAGLTAEALVSPGDPEHVLVEDAEAWEADCIFVGAQGLNAVERTVLGSVSSAVAVRASCSVEVVRSG